MTELEQENAIRSLAGLPAIPPEQWEQWKKFRLMAECPSLIPEGKKLKDYLPR